MVHLTLFLQDNGINNISLPTYRSHFFLLLFYETYRSLPMIIIHINHALPPCQISKACIRKTKGVKTQKNHLARYPQFVGHMVHLTFILKDNDINDIVALNWYIDHQFKSEHNIKFMLFPITIFDTKHWLHHTI